MLIGTTPLCLCITIHYGQTAVGITEALDLTKDRTRYISPIVTFTALPFIKLTHNSSLLREAHSQQTGPVTLAPATIKVARESEKRLQNRIVTRRIQPAPWTRALNHKSFIK
jgi:hypothetical protein